MYFVGGGFSFIVIGESISDSAEYVHVCLQVLFFFFLTLSLVSYVTLDSLVGFMDLNILMNTWRP